MIDAHIHLWDTRKLNYDWLEQVPIINRDFLIEDYNDASGDQEIEAMVFVQAECHPEQHLEELKWVQSIADNEPRLKAIIPWAPLEDGDGVASELADISGDPRVKGVRRIIEFEEDIDFCIQPGFIRGVQLLAENGLHCELTIGPRNFPNVSKLIKACPDTRFILDHIGCPNIANGELQPWKDLLKSFADSGPHYCKFSNLVCNADLENWTLEDLKPFADAVFESFGEDRIIWGSDWPHALRASSYPRWAEAAQALTSGFSKEGQQKIYRDNAANFYRI